MLAKSVSGAEQAGQETPQQQMETHPVIRTLYDHTAVGILYATMKLYLNIWVIVSILSFLIVLFPIIISLKDLDNNSWLWR